MRKRNRLIWQLYPPYLVLILLSLIAVSYYATRSLNDFFFNRTRAELETHARIVEGQLRTPISAENIDLLDAFCKNLGKDTATRITILLPNGQVVGDSNETARLMENHGNRPEIQDRTLRGHHRPCSRRDLSVFLPPYHSLKGSTGWTRQEAECWGEQVWGSP